ncbi:hypothetical protein [Kitasatospora sp. NPDC087271]|uniref:hypothetical protein n=1 Tax=Kitasatospora sp. NPDC087271 TaxID=3364067 RepID=UPI0038281B2B
MDKKKILIGCGAVLALGAVLSLFEDKPDKATAEAKPSASAPAAPGQQPADEAPKPTSAIPSPDSAQTVALMAALKAVDPGLVAKQDRAVSRARNTCLDARENKDAATVQKNTKSRFEGGTVPSLTDDQAAQIVTAVKSTFCG